LLNKCAIALSLFFSATTFGADVPISGLPAASTVSGADIVPIVQSGTTKKATFTVQKNLWDTFYQPLDADLTALAALGGTHTIYYRSAANTWTAVTIGSGLDFTGATLSTTGTGLAPSTAHYVTTQAESGLSAEFSLGSLASGILKQAVSGSVSTPAIATSSDITALFSGCSGSQYLGADGACHSAGSGTVTHTGGALTLNSVVLGAGTDDVKVVAGIITDGTAKLTLGVNTATLGQLKLFGNTSGDATIQPAAVAGTSTVVTLPNASSTLPIFGQQITFSGPTAARTITLPDAAFTVARTDAAQTFTGVQTFSSSPVISAITNTGTVTLFTATDTVVGRATTDTLTNKRITPRITTISSSATPTINTDNCDAVTITALAAAITSMTTNLSGTPNNFDRLLIRIKDDGTARAITWGASFEAKGVALPTTTVLSKVLTVGFLYDTVTSKWGCVASAQEL
jgi:hypothetical protein